MINNDIFFIFVIPFAIRTAVKGPGNRSNGFVWDFFPLYPVESMRQEIFESVKKNERARKNAHEARGRRARGTRQ
jgi:hypothetical protein